MCVNFSPYVACMLCMRREMEGKGREAEGLVEGWEAVVEGWRLCGGEMEVVWWRVGGRVVKSWRYVVGGKYFIVGGNG